MVDGCTGASEQGQLTVSITIDMFLFEYISAVYTELEYHGETLQHCREPIERNCVDRVHVRT